MPPVLLRGRQHRIVRWIGAGAGRLPRPGADAAAPKGHVIKLCWSDTFGRPVRSDAGLSRTTPAQVLPFRGRDQRRGTEPVPGCDAG